MWPEGFCHQVGRQVPKVLLETAGHWGLAEQALGGGVMGDPGLEEVMFLIETKLVRYYL